MAGSSSGRGASRRGAGRGRFLALGEAPVERLTDKGVRSLDARAAVVKMDVLEPAIRRRPGPPEGKIVPFFEWLFCIRLPLYGPMTC